MRPSIRLSLVLALVVAMGPLEAQARQFSEPLPDYNLVSWDGASGLPSGNIWSIVQDPLGYIWLGTDEGVIRFDGARFVPWSALSRSPLPERRALSLLIATDGSLWIGFGGIGGISRVQNLEAHNYDKTDGVPGDFVRALREDRSGHIWASSPSGFYRFGGQRWEKVGPARGVPEGPARSAYEDSEGNFWVIVGDGLFRRDGGSETFHPVQAGTGQIRDLTQSATGSMVTSDPAVGFRTLDRPGGRVAQPAASLPRGYGVRVMHDRRGDLWVGTQGQGLWRVTERPGSQPPTVQIVTTREGLSADEVRSLLEDREGNIWVGTTAGLHRFSPKLVGTMTGLGLVRAVARTEDGMIAAGSSEGLFKLSGPRARPRAILTASVFALHNDAKGTLWIGTNHGLFRLRDGRVSPVQLPPGVPLRQIVAIASDPAGGLWLCDQGRGVFYWNAGTLTPYPLAPDVNRKTAYAVFVDSQGRVWIAFSGGILGRVESRHEVRSFGPNSDGSLRVIIEGRDGALWLGGDDGLTRFANGQFVTAGRKNGFPGSAVSAVVEDPLGYIWAGVGSAIIRLDPREFDELAANASHPIRFKLYDGSDGIAGAPLWSATPSATRGPNDTLWFVTGAGLTVLDPSALERSRLAPRAQVAAVVADEEVLGGSLQGVELRPLIHRLQVEYTDLSFVSPMKVRFRYKLDGFDRDWIYAGTARQAVYTNLPPRRYRFRVAAATSDGMWTESGVAWDFSVQPAFYQTWWFVGGCALLVLPVIWGAWWLRMRQIQHRFSLVLSERARISREIHDTLLQSLVGVALQFEGLSRRVGPSSPSLKEHLVRIRVQVEEYIREARRSISNLRSAVLEQRDLVSAITDTGQQITAGKPMQFTVEVSGTPKRCGPSVEEQALRMGREALYNAVLHANARHISVHFHYTRRSLLIKVVDDGEGFDGRQLDGHYGLASMRERASQAGATLTIDTGIGTGTQVEMVFPMVGRS